MTMSSWHIPSLSEKWDILQESNPQSPTNPFHTVSLTKSGLQTIASFLPPFAPVNEGGRAQKRQREWEREAGIHLLHRSTLSGPVNVLCDQATGTGRLGPHDLITPLTKSPELSLREIREARPQGPGRTRQPQNISGTLHLCWPTSL